MAQSSGRGAPHFREWVRRQHKQFLAQVRRRQLSQHPGQQLPDLTMGSRYVVNQYARLAVAAFHQCALQSMFRHVESHQHALQDGDGGVHTRNAPQPANRSNAGLSGSRIQRLCQCGNGLEGPRAAQGNERSPASPSPCPPRLTHSHIKQSTLAQAIQQPGQRLRGSHLNVVQQNGFHNFTVERVEPPREGWEFA